MASTAHQTQDQERNSPSHRAGCLPARSLASVLRQLECPIRSPFIESFLLCQILPASQQGPGFTLDFPVLPEHRCYYLSLPSVLEVFSSPGQGIPDEPPNVMPNVQIPQREKRRPPRQCNMQRKGNLLLTRVRAPAATNAVVQSQRALSPSFYIHL